MLKALLDIAVLLAGDNLVLGQAAVGWGFLRHGFSIAFVILGL